MGEVVCASHQQEWLWNLLQMSPSWNCTLVAGWRLRGSLDAAHLCACVAAVRRAHGVLRTRLVHDDGNLFQEIIDPAAEPLACIEVAGGDLAQTNRNATVRYEELACYEFDVAAEPPLRLELLRLSVDEHWLLLAIHRLLVDCFSVEQIFAEVWKQYRSPATRSAPDVEEMPQYAAYAATQRRAHEAWTQRHSAYWHRKTADACPLRWPTVDSRVAAESRTLGRMQCLFGKELSTGIHALARRERSLPGTVVLAIYVALLWRWCGQLKFIVPFNVAGRLTAQRSMIGFFSHILYLRFELSGARTFAELLRVASNEFYQSLSHQDFGMAATQRPDLTAGTFVQWVTRHGAAQAESPGPELHVERLACRDFAEDLTAIPPGMVDVEVSFFDAEDGIHALGCYRADRFAASTMERFMDELRSTAERFVQDPHAELIGPQGGQACVDSVATLR